MRKTIWFFRDVLVVFATLFMVVEICMCRIAHGATETGVSVYAEGAYTDNDLVVYVYADIPSSMALVSMGVKINYDASKLNVASMEKNEDIWYFGTNSQKYPYKDPEDIGTAVIIIGGKLDTSNPTAGVTGDRVLLGKVKFTRSDNNDPGIDPEGYFGISIELGKGGNYANFVDTDGNDLDDNGVSFTSVTVRERGDANGDKSITSADMFKVQSMVGGAYVVYADCNDDSLITSADMFCIQNKI